MLLNPRQEKTSCVFWMNQVSAALKTTPMAFWLMIWQPTSHSELQIMGENIGTSLGQEDEARKDLGDRPMEKRKWSWSPTYSRA